MRRILGKFFPVEIIDMIQEKAQYWSRLLAHNDKPLVQSRTGRTGTDNRSHYLISPPLPLPPAGITEDGKEVQVKVKQVMFWIRSRDQGEWDWDPELEQDEYPTALPGSYEGSWTWFEACIYRCLPSDARADLFTGLEKHNIPPPTDKVLQGVGIERVPRPSHEGLSGIWWHVQSNISESNQVKMHKILWTDKFDEDDKTEIINETGAGRGVGFVNSLKGGDRIALISSKSSQRASNRIREAAIEAPILSHRVTFLHF
ncbi:hypothetical protein BDQ17DRAFT_1426501 [Cyathus striatus]|nr:hypothetical protein BDQ17DRAFT_1426501 [Cyathus striatus]